MIQDTWGCTLAFVPTSELFAATRSLLAVSKTSRLVAIKTMLCAFRERLARRLKKQTESLTPEWTTADMLPHQPLSDRMAALSTAVERRDLVLVRHLSAKCTRSPLWSELLLFTRDPEMANALVDGFSKYSHSAALCDFYARHFDNRQMASIAKNLLTRQQCKQVESALVSDNMIEGVDARRYRKWLLLSNRPDALPKIVRHFGFDGLQVDMRRYMSTKILWEYVMEGLPLDKDPDLVVYAMMHASPQQRLGIMEAYAEDHKVVVRMLEFEEFITPRYAPYLERLRDTLAADQVSAICRRFLRGCLHPELAKESMARLNISLSHRLSV